MNSLDTLPRLSLPEFHHLVDGMIAGEYQIMTVVDEDGRHYLTIEICDQTAALLKVQSQTAVGLRLTQDGQTAASWGTLANAATVFTQTAIPRNMNEFNQLLQRYEANKQATAAIQAVERERIGTVLRQMAQRERAYVAFLRGQS